MTVVIPACVGCTRKTDRWDESNACEAFPGGVPKEIKFGKNGHMAPMPDGSDNGLFFDPVPGFEFFRDSWWADGGMGGVLASDSYSSLPGEEEQEPEGEEPQMRLEV